MDEKRLVLVDADGPPRQAMAEQAAGLGFAVEAAETGAFALVSAAPACRLLVAGTPRDMSIAGLCEAWRKAGGGPVLVLSSDHGSNVALEAAGAIVLAKPIRLAELAAALKETARPPTPAMELGAARFDPATRELTGEAQASVRLTEKEAAILVYLHRAPDRAVPRDELLAQVWSYAGAVTTHTLETHIYRLRRKLASCAGAPQLVSDGGGYRLEDSKPR